MTGRIFLAAALLAAGAAAAENGAAKGDGKKGKAKAAKTVDFHDMCSNAWIKCETDREFLSYAPGDEMKFVFTLAGVTNDVPKEKFFWTWKRTGDDGAEETGKAPLDTKKLVVPAKTDAPGFVRVFAELSEADGKPFLARKAGKPRQMSFMAGACAGFDSLTPPPLPGDFAKRVADAKRKLARVPFKKYGKTKIEDSGINGTTLYAISVPCEGERPVTGYLTVPESQDKTAKFPCRISFDLSGFAKEQKQPEPKHVKLDEIAFTLLADPGKKEERTEASCMTNLMRIARSVQFLKTLPEWDGTRIVASGWGEGAAFALWAAACGEGVTKAECGLLSYEAPEPFGICNLARLVPPGCMVFMERCCPGDPAHPGADTARLWNALKCDRRAVWTQGAATWSAPNYKGASQTIEKIRPIGFRNMTADRCIAGKPFDDLPVSVRDKVVLEAIFDYEKPVSFDPHQAEEVASQASSDRKPLTIYATILDRRPKQKPWLKFLESKSGKGESWRYPFPVYADAGMDLPAPASLPCFRVADAAGTVRYEGPDLAKAAWHVRNSFAKLPKPDPLFEYAKPDLLKNDIEKMQKAKFTPSRMLKSIEMLQRKYDRSDPARRDEAEHLATGMKQAVQRRLAGISKNLSERPGIGLSELQEVLAGWPALATHPVAAHAKNLVSAHPDYEKLAKLEKEMARLFAWKPEKQSDMKKKEAALAALRAKATRFSKSKDVTMQGEAMTILAELDNPPQDGDGQQGAEEEQQQQ